MVRKSSYTTVGIGSAPTIGGIEVGEHTRTMGLYDVVADFKGSEMAETIIQEGSLPCTA